MADPLGSLEKIVKLALRIKEAVDTVRHNKEECQQIRTRAVRVSSLLSRLPETGITGDPAMCDALGDLEEALRHAHALVTTCQQSGTVCLYCTASKQARRLRKAQDDISQKVMLVVFATNIHTTIILTNCIRVPPLVSPAVGAPIIPHVVVPCNNSAGGASSTEDVQSINVPLPRLTPSAPAVQESAPAPFPTMVPLSALETSQAICARTPDMDSKTSTVSKRDPSLSTVIRNEVARQGSIRLAGRVVSESLFNSGTEYPSDDDQPLFVSDDEACEAQDSFFAEEDHFEGDMIVDLCMEREEELLENIVEQGLRKFSSSELEAATHHFSMENMVGSGAFATVYKGVLHDGLVVAVKKFQHPYVLSAGNLDKLHLISNLKHKNIVKLIGYSEVLWNEKLFENAKVEGKADNETSYLLVEEYMPNGSLDKAINGLQLNWSSHLHLIQGIALGLCYLQEKGFVHMDVKPSNILLDSDMNSKITDFGIARVLNRTGVDICSDIAIAGTLGYMPPEYITNGTLSKKHDVYGFGVTILEIVSGLSRSGRASGQASIKWAWEARQAGGIMQQLDASRFDTPQLKEIERCIEVGLLCTQFEPADRPDILDALKMLCGEKALRTPVRPAYTSKEPVSWLRRWLGR